MYRMDGAIMIMKDDHSDIEKLIAQATDAVEVSKAEASVPVRYRTVKTVVRDKNNRIARVDEVQVPIDPAVERVKRTAERMKTPDLLKLVREVLFAELNKRADLPEAGVRFSQTELADLDTDRDEQ